MLHSTEPERPGTEAEGAGSAATSTLRRWVWRALAGLLVVAGALILYQVITWPDVAALRTENPEATAFIERYRERQRRADRPDRVAWQWVPYGRISPHLKRAVVAAEDMEFFFHRGFSTSEMRAALRAALEEGRPLRGASTITQQLAKNLWLTPSRNPWRKLKEAILTRQLERRLTKARILELYLNVAEFGTGIYGVEAAARRYFGKPAAEVTEREAAMLAAGLPRPKVWHPGRETRGYQRYVAEIEGRMARAEFLWRYVGGAAPPPESPQLDSLASAADPGGDSITPDSVSSDTLLATGPPPQ